MFAACRGVFIILSTRIVLREVEEFLAAYCTTSSIPQRLNVWVARESPQECIKAIQGFVEVGAGIVCPCFPARSQIRWFARLVHGLLPAFH
jgi:hypothetical protein